jgi:hypothetical protein
LVGRQWFAFGRHPFGVIGCDETLNERAFGAVSEGEDGTFLAALVDEGAGIEPESAFLLQSAMAAEATFFENGSDLAFVVGLSGFGGAQSVVQGDDWGDEEGENGGESTLWAN